MRFENLMGIGFQKGQILRNLCHSVRYGMNRVAHIKGSKSLSLSYLDFTSVDAKLRLSSVPYFSLLFCLMFLNSSLPILENAQISLLFHSKNSLSN